MFDLRLLCSLGKEYLYDNSITDPIPLRNTPAATLLGCLNAFITAVRPIIKKAHTEFGALSPTTPSADLLLAQINSGGLDAQIEQLELAVQQRKNAIGNDS